MPSFTAPCVCFKQRCREEGHGIVQGQASAPATLCPSNQHCRGEGRMLTAPEWPLGTRVLGLELTACNGRSLSEASSSAGTHPAQGTLRSLLWSPEGTTEAPAGRC